MVGSRDREDDRSPELRFRRDDRGLPALFQASLQLDIKLLLQKLWNVPNEYRKISQKTGSRKEHKFLI
jgi:hypothetical protein